MTWIDRQREAAVTTPDGTRFEFIYEDLERNRSDNTSVFRFAELSGAFIDRLSAGEDIYPIAMIFSGPDYDLEAADFWERSKKPGVFLLEHPRFPGLRKVQLMTMRQRVAAKSGDNQSIIDAVFHETIDIVTPSAVLDATTAILDKSNELNGQASESFGDNASLDNAIIVTDLQSESKTFIDKINDIFSETVAKEAALKSLFDAQYLSISSIISDIVDKPLEFAGNATVFLSTPSRVAIDISERVTAYRTLFDDTIDRIRYSSDQLLEASRNRGALAVLASLGIISAMCQSSVSSAEYGTKTEVIAIADEIIDTVDIALEVLDEYAEGLASQEDPADRRFEITDARNTLNELASLTTGQLFNVAFTLKQERFITLQSDSDPVLLCHTLYGFSDDNMDFMIETNQIKGDELFQLPKGKEIVYFV